MEQGSVKLFADTKNIDANQATELAHMTEHDPKVT